MTHTNGSPEFPGRFRVILAVFNVLTKDLMLFIAHDIINEGSEQDICTSWDILPDTLTRWKKDPKFKMMCLVRGRT